MGRLVLRSLINRQRWSYNWHQEGSCSNLSSREALEIWRGCDYRMECSYKAAISNRCQPRY